MYEVEDVRGNLRTSKKIFLPEERGITIYINGREFITLSASPSDEAYLALGFLFTEGVIENLHIIKEYNVDDNGGVWIETKKKISNCKARKKVLTSGCGKGMVLNFNGDKLKKLRKRKKISGEVLLNLVKKGLSMGEEMKESRGLHTAFLFNSEGIISLKNDIGRHNAVDKVIGEALTQGNLRKGLVLASTGRLSSEIVLKALRAQIPILTSLSSPTDAAVELADKFGQTLAGYVRGKRMILYTHTWRIV
jgi:FdhD protein